jgi:hypothetical protein
MARLSECFAFIKKGDQGIVHGGMYDNFSAKLAKFTGKNSDTKTLLHWQSSYGESNLELSQLIQEIGQGDPHHKLQNINKFNRMMTAVVDFYEMQYYCAAFDKTASISIKTFLKTPKRIFNLGFDVLNQERPRPELIDTDYNKTLNTLSRSLWPALPISTIIRGKVRIGSVPDELEPMKGDFTELRFIPTATDNCSLKIAQSAYYRHLLNIASQSHAIDLGQHRCESKQLNIVEYTELRTPFLCLLSFNGKTIPFIANVDSEEVLVNTMEFLNLSAQVSAYINLHHEWQFTLQ